MAQMKRSVADHVDIHRKLLFLSMLLLSVVFAIKTMLYLVDGSLTDILSVTAKGIVVLFFMSLALTVYWKQRFIPGIDRYDLMNSQDSFVSQVMNQAFKTSWILTFIALNIVAMTTGRDHSKFPAEFYLYLVLFIMLAGFSITFLILFRDNEKED